MIDDRLIILLDVENILTKNELIGLGAISDMVSKAEQAPKNADKKKKKANKTPKKAGSTEVNN